MGAQQHETPSHSVSVGGVVLDASSTRVLLIQRRDNNCWEPLGDVLELDESIEDGPRHEIEGETGVTVHIAALTGVYKNMRRAIVSLVFRCTALNEALNSSAEAVAVAWVPVTDVEALMDSAYSERVIEAVNDGQVSVSAHDGTRIIDDCEIR